MEIEREQLIRAVQNVTPEAVRVAGNQGNKQKVYEVSTDLKQAIGEGGKPAALRILENVK